MAAAPQAWIQGSPQRALPGFQSDNLGSSIPARFDSYGGLNGVSVLTGRETALADEGAYWVTNNAQTGIAPTYGTSLSATAPYIIVQNTAASPGPSVVITYISLTAIAAGACTTTTGYTAISVVLDTIARYSSAGTNLTGNIVCPNNLRASPVSVQAYCGAITAGAASANARTIVGIRNIRPGVSSTVISVVGDMQYLTFGAIEGAAGNITVANANIIPIPLPPVIIAPGCSMLLYVWYPVLTAPSAATYAPEIGGFIR